MSGETLIPVRGSLRRRDPGEPLAGARIGLVPIIWNNVDVASRRRPVSADHVLDETARLGYQGTQLGVGFPSGEALARELRRRGLRLAEAYVALPCSTSGPAGDALELGRARLGELLDADGEVLVVAVGGGPERDAWSGRASGAPGLEPEGWRRLGAALDELGRLAAASGRRMAFHPHVGSWVETPQELERLAAHTEPELVGICLDVGHYLVGGGEPVQALLAYGERVVHLHLKDVAPEPLAALRAGRIAGFRSSLEDRIFAPLGSGIVDLAGVLRILAARDYRGWLMVEQDTSWEPPSEAAAIGRRVLDAAMRSLAAERSVAA